MKYKYNFKQEIIKVFLKEQKSRVKTNSNTHTRYMHMLTNLYIANLYPMKQPNANDTTPPYDKH